MFSKTIISLAVITSLLVLPQRIVSQEIKINELSINEQINYFADKYGVDSSLMKKIVQCESHGNVEALGDGKRAYGILQYHLASFQRHEELLGEDLDYYSSLDQLKLGTWAISQGYGREWTSYRAIKNGGTYSFYSKLLKKSFTVTCK